MAKKDKLASVLAFEKKLVPSDGYLYGTQWEQRHEKEHVVPLTLREKSVRGTISNRLKKALQSDPAKLDAEVEKANLQTVDSCALDIGQDTLKLHFTLKVLGGVETPSACNNNDFQQSYTQAARSYIEAEGFTELAQRYAQNIANARFLWRNRVGAEQIEVCVTWQKEDESKSLCFDATEYSLRNFDAEDAVLNELTEEIAKALSGHSSFLLLDIQAFAKVGKAQEVYPSEELVLDKGNSKSKKSKILYSVNDIAALHSQKIGNALRTIDDWYPEAQEEGIGPIAVEPYGAVTNLGKAFRTPKAKSDFYSLFDKWALGEPLEKIEDQHYVMATLVRGGVFGESGKE